MYYNIKQINDKYGFYFDYIKGRIKGNKFIQYLLIEKTSEKEYKTLLKVNKTNNKEIFINLNK
tara:strand:+ start:437 stop:625 length:189 start_codon:yes stop_codon:yes gene_type:complete